MDLTELGLSTEQLQSVTDFVNAKVSETKEGFKDFIPKADLDKAISSKEKEHNKALKGLQDELLKYKPPEKSEAEKALEERLQKLELREKEMQDKEALFNLQNVLKENKLPVGLASYLKSDADIVKITEVFNQHLLDSSFKPQNNNSNSFTGLTREQFTNMSYADKAKLYTENQELYIQLSK